MADALERELRQLGGDRPLPRALYGRLEAALLEDADMRHGGDDDVATALAGMGDGPRPMPPATRAALEQALVRSTHRMSRVILAVAAAVLLVVGSVAVLRSGGSSSNRNVAAGPPRSVPAAGVPPVLQAPATTLPATAGAAAAEPVVPTTRRSPPTTAPWNCGLCAQNGYTGSANPPPPPTTVGGTFQPVPGGSVEGVTAASASEGFTVEPASGPHRGGTVVTLTGFGFTGANGVRFGSTAAANFTVVSDTEIRVQVPPSPTPQKVTVSVTYGDGSATPTSDSGPFFTYT
jgi:hypothetical protein